MGTVCQSSRNCAGATTTSACSCGRSTCSSSTAKTWRREPIEVRKATLASVLRSCRAGLQFNKHLEHPGDIVFRHACKMGLEGIVSKRLGRVTSAAGRAIG